MSDTETPTDSETHNSTTDSTPPTPADSETTAESTDYSGDETSERGAETVDPATRRELLEDADHRCEFCYRRGQSAGGIATLEIHHADRDSDDGEPHDLEQLLVVCRACHNWHHKRPTETDIPIELTETERRMLLPHDYQILDFLARNGPATTSEIVTAIEPDLSRLAVRERLWLLMGLDNKIGDRDEQLIDQDRDTSEWGLPGQITQSARGHIPQDPQTLIQRVEDEHVRRALDRGLDREIVAQVLGIVSRTTRHKERRARAYDFPLDAIDGRKDSPHSHGNSASAGESSSTQTASDMHQHQQTGPSETSEASDGDETQPARSAGYLEADEHTMSQLDDAIDALQALKAALVE